MSLSRPSAHARAREIEQQSRRVYENANKLDELREFIAASKFRFAAGALDRAAVHLREVDAMWEDREDKS